MKPGDIGTRAAGEVSGQLTGGGGPQPGSAVEAPAGFDRRDFFKIAGSGLFVFFSIGSIGEGEVLTQEPERLPQRASYPTDFNAYLRVHESGRVTCFVGKVELGQGAKTTLAQLLADELDVAFDAVDMVMGDTDQCPWDMGTFGSLTVRQFGPVLRAACAEARGVLLELAAERLGVPVSGLQVRDGVATASADVAKKVTYAELTRGQRIERHLQPRPAPKAHTALRVIGSTPRRKDALEKVTGRAKYAGDQSLPGTLHARIVRPPAHGATLVSADTTAAEKMPGVRVVRDGSLVAVLHERPDLAQRALETVRPVFTRPEATVDDRSIFDHLVQNAPPGRQVSAAGDLAEGERQSARVFDHTYYNSYVAHAAVETHSAAARFEGEKVTVWASTQAPFTVKSQVAQALKLKPEDVRVITPYVGGGFGGKTSGPQAVEAARLARLTGRPVQVVWDRGEEFFFDTFRPAAVVKIRSGVSSAGAVTFWDFTVYGAGDREAASFYDAPHHRTMSHGGWSGQQPAGFQMFEVGPWRAPSVNTNTHARESQFDIMAAALRVDPLEFRMRHLRDPRHRRVVEAAAAKFGWTPRPAPSGRGVGVALGMYSGTYVATFAEVAVDKASGAVKVKRVVCAQEMGLIVNPDGSKQQVEGCITMGLGYPLTEEVRFKGGQVLETNFDSYEPPRFSWLPAIETILVNAPEQPSQGCGEPPIVTMGAVIANAIFDATGARLFQLPMTPERVTSALQAAGKG